ncbi:transposase [Brevibacillus laterosporus]|uniref:transposase n=1 Tax=Brevibacillus laterosporus TaxID=1465 RepID=UPI003555E537
MAALPRVSVQKQKEEQKLKMIITAAYQRFKGIYGYPRIQAWLRQTHGIPSIINAYID